MSPLCWHLLSSHWSSDFYVFWYGKWCFYFDLDILGIMLWNSGSYFRSTAGSLWSIFSWRRRALPPDWQVAREVQVPRSVDLVMVFHYCWRRSSAFPLGLRWHYPSRRGWHDLLLLPRWSPRILQVVGGYEHPDSPRPPLIPLQLEKRSRATSLP